MPKIKPNEIVEQVRGILENISRTNQGNPFVTAYQILEKLPCDLRNRLIAERSRPGKGSGFPYSAASVVADAAEMLKPNIQIEMLNTAHIKIKCENQQLIDAGTINIGLYRLID